MLSYQHIYHAGNHADVLKHLTMYLLLEGLLKKDKPFTVFDTHAGSGIYHFSDERAAKTGEAQSGIFRLIDTEPDDFELQAAAPWISLCRRYAAENSYPGSPEIARNLLRSDDNLILSERHPLAIEELRTSMHTQPLGRTTPGQVQAHIHFTDGWQMLTALTPPHIKRGIVLMDPSYEDTEDFTRCSSTLSTVHAKWSAGILALWYPLVQRRHTEITRMKQVITTVAKSSPTHPAILDVQMTVTQPDLLPGLSALYGSGMFIVNAPYGLEPSLSAVLPAISRIVAPENGTWSIESY